MRTSNYVGYADFDMYVTEIPTTYFVAKSV